MRKFIKLAFVAAFAAIAGYGVYTGQKSDEMSDLLIANVEALADSSEGGASPCGGPKENGECQSKNAVNCKDTTGCQ